MTALSGTHFTTCMPPAPVPLVRVGHQEVDTSVLNGFSNSQQFRSRALFTGRRVGGLAVLVGSVPEKWVFLRVVARFGFQFRGRFEPSSWCAGRAYGALRAGNRDPDSGLLWACRGVPTLAGAGCTCGPGPEPPVPYPESWSTRCHRCA